MLRRTQRGEWARRGRWVLALALLALPAVGAHARDKPTAAFTAELTSAGQPTAKTAGWDEPLFAWPADQTIAAVLTLDLAGYAGQRRVDLHAALFEEPAGGAEPKKHQHPLAKLAGQYDLAAGHQRVAFPKLWETAELSGRRNFRLELEVSLKGADEAQQVLHFICAGPPAPTMKLLRFEAWNSVTPGQPATLWQPTDQLTLNLVFELQGNQARRGPVLTLLALLEEDRQLMNLDTSPSGTDQNWELRQLPPEDGTYQLICHASLPQYFNASWSNDHPFTLYAALDSGTGTPLKAEVQGRITDYHPGELRVNDDLALRLIRLDRAQQWDLHRLPAGAASAVQAPVP